MKKRSKREEHMAATGWLSAREMAESLFVHVSQVHRRARSGKLTTTEFKGQRFYKEKEMS